MKVLKTALSLSALGCTALIAVAGPAHSATLLDLLRGNNKSSIVNVQTQSPAVSKSDALAADLSDPLPRVKSPTYNTYKAEALRPVNLAKIGDITGVEAAIAPAGTQSGDGVAVTPVSTEKPKVKAVRATESVAAAMETFYAQYKAPLWVTEGAVSEKARSVMSTLAKADEIGLDASDYLVSEPDVALVSSEAEKRAVLAGFELALTNSVLTYVQDTIRGRVDPNKISGYHDFTRKTVNLVGALKVMAMSPDVSAYLASRTPDSSHFAALVAELAKLKSEVSADQPQIVIDPATLLKPGNSSPELPNIIAAIQAKGSDKLKVDHAVELSSYTGGQDYTPELVDVVKAFQAENNLKPDGIVGKTSIRIMLGGDKTADKIAKVQIALEQARWLPNDLGSRRVFINEPEFMVHYWDNNAEQFAMKVVVGGRNTQTYFFQDQIETVEFNPYWGVPHSIIVNEMLPKLRANPGYLDELGYEVSVNGQAVSSSQIDWYQTDSVDVRQPPGRGNALGELKILFPNSHSIYMHDTPQKSFFAKDMRALSHGCVRLAEPRKMAAAVLGISEADVASQIAGGQNKQVSVPAKIPVYVAYFTAWPNKDGVVEYFDDVYERDVYTNRAMQAVSASRKTQI